MTAPQAPGLLHPQEASAILGVGVKSVARMADDGRIPAAAIVLTRGGHRRYRLDFIESAFPACVAKWRAAGGAPRPLARDAHGTFACYVESGCKCAPCSLVIQTANALGRARRKLREGLPLTDLELTAVALAQHEARCAA